ncbi:MAG TPA: helix-turn-helix transcriptional regulator [Stenomitos sp.]
MSIKMIKLSLPAISLIGFRYQSDYGGMKKLRCKLRILMAAEDPPITQAQLAKEILAGPNTINKLYNNTFKRIDAETVEKICHYFNCDISDLFELKVPVEKGNRRSGKP